MAALFFLLRKIYKAYYERNNGLMVEYRAYFGDEGSIPSCFSFISGVEKRKENAMKKGNFKKVVHITMNNLNKGLPFMLSCCSAAGVVITTVFAVRATPKALRKIQTDSKKNHDGDDGAYTPLEAIILLAAMYLSIIFMDFWDWRIWKEGMSLSGAWIQEYIG